MELFFAFFIQLLILAIIGVILYLMFGPRRDWELFSVSRGGRADHSHVEVDRYTIVHQLRSSSNAVALEAVRKARAEGWLSDGTLVHANLRLANLQHADLHDSTLRGANLHYGNLAYSDLRGSDLSQADLGEANLRGADLRDASVQGANLSEATLADAQLTGARSDAKTRWPQSFDESAAGVVGVETAAMQEPEER